MITSLISCRARPVTRETALVVRGRSILVRLREGGRLIQFREKRTRTWYTATIEQCYWLAVRNAAEDLKRQRALARAEKRRLRGATA